MNSTNFVQFCQLSPVRPFQHCIGCGWKLERDNKWRPTEYRCENRFCREDVFYDIDKWAFRSKAWEVSVWILNSPSLCH